MSEVWSSPNYMSQQLNNKTCTNYISCINCKGNHFAYSQECATWRLEKRVQQVRVEKHLSFPDARKLVEAETPVVVGKSHAVAAKVSTRSVSINTDLTWRYDEATYKKTSDVQKTNKQLQNRLQKQHNDKNKLYTRHGQQWAKHH